MKILILGCGGFIGSHLIGRLIYEGRHEIVGIDNDEYKIREHLSSFSFERRDVYSDERRLETQIADADLVVFLASICNPSLYVRDPAETIRSNFSRPAAVVEACARHGTWLMAFSTCEVYGRTLSSYVGDDYADVSLYLQKEDTTPSVLGPVRATRWSYAAAKQLLERYILALHEQEGMPFTTIRPYNFFGARMDYIPNEWNSGVPRVLASFMDALMNGKPIKLVDGGTARRTITYIDDAIDAVIRMIDNRERAVGEIFNIGNPDNEITIRELAVRMRNIYADMVGDPGYRNHPIETIESKNFYGKGYEDCDRRVPDISKSRALLGWQPRYGIDETLRKAVEFFVDFEAGPDRARAGERR